MIARRERWSYAAGDLGFNFVWQSTELYLLFYFIRGLGISPALASAIFLVGAAVDWAVDPLIGTLADRWAPRIPLRAWVLIGGPASVLLLAMTFAPLPGGHSWMPAVALIAYLALRAAYGIGNIPYAALTARISPLPQDHLALTSARMQGAAIGGLIAALVFALLPPTAAGADFRHGALLLAALAMPAFLATAFGVRERVVPGVRAAGGTARHTLRDTIAPLAQSAALRRLLATVLACGLAVTVVNKSLLFLFDELHALRLGYFVAIAPAASLLLSTPLWALLGARIGRARTLLGAAMLKVAATAAALVLSGVAAVVVLTCVAIVAGCGMSVMFWSLVPEAVADCERAVGSEGCAGRVYALANMARKLAQALAPSVVALTAAGKPGTTLFGMTASAAVAAIVVALYGPRRGTDAARAVLPRLQEQSI